MYMIINEHLNTLSRFIRSPINLTEGYEAIKDPAIAHFSLCWPKVWSNDTRHLFNHNETCFKYQKEFYYYANKTKYYSLIHNLLY